LIDNTGPNYTAPAVKAHPAPSAQPGYNNHGAHHIESLVNDGYHR
jgi:hypothetical protein